MSRLNSLSASALRAMYSQETGEQIIMLITIQDPTDANNPVRLSDGYLTRLSSLSTDTDIIYGVHSRGHDYVFLPITVGLPQEQEIGASACKLQLNYVTPEAIELIRAKLTRPTDVTIEMVLSSSPDTVEASFTGFSIIGATYSADNISLDLTMVSLTREPFPCFNFTPTNFPGLF